MRVPDPEIITNDPTLAGAKDDDVVAGGHGRDDATTPGGVPLEGIDGEETAAASTGVHDDRRKSETLKS